MPPIRGLNNATASPSTNITNNVLTMYLRNSPNYHNITAYEHTLGDPTVQIPFEFSSSQIVAVCAFIIVCSLGVLIAQTLERKGITHKLKLYTLKYIAQLKELNKQEVLPVYHPKKAKESPFVSSMPAPQTLSQGLAQCPRLEGVENLMFKLSVPYRRFQSSENLPNDAEHRITITTFVENS